MTSNDLRDQAALEQRLQALRADLRDALTKAHKRMWAVRLMLVLLVLLTTGYLFFLYHELSKLDAAAVTDLAYYKLQPYLDDSPTMLRDELRRRAPQLIGIAEKSVLDAPKVGGEYLRDVFNEQVKEAFNKAQPQVEQVIRETLASLKANSEKAGYNLKEKADVDRLVNDAVAQFGKHSSEAIDKFRVEFALKSESVMTGLSDLAEAKDLTALQERHRDILVSFLALTEKWKTEPPPLVGDENQAKQSKPVITLLPKPKDGAAPSVTPTPEATPATQPE